MSVALKVLRQCHYCKYYSQGIVVFLVSNGHIDSELLTECIQSSILIR